MINFLPPSLYLKVKDDVEYNNIITKLTSIEEKNPFSYHLIYVDDYLTLDFFEYFRTRIDVLQLELKLLDVIEKKQLSKYENVKFLIIKYYNIEYCNYLLKNKKELLAKYSDEIILFLQNKVRENEYIFNFYDVLKFASYEIEDKDEKISCECQLISLKLSEETYNLNNSFWDDNIKKNKNKIVKLYESSETKNYDIFTISSYLRSFFDLKILDIENITKKLANDNECIIFIQSFVEMMDNKLEEVKNFYGEKHKNYDIIGPYLNKRINYIKFYILRIVFSKIFLYVSNPTVETYKTIETTIHNSFINSDDYVYKMYDLNYLGFMFDRIKNLFDNGFFEESLEVAEETFLLIKNNYENRKILIKALTSHEHSYVVEFLTMLKCFMIYEEEIVHGYFKKNKILSEINFEENDKKILNNLNLKKREEMMDNFYFSINWMKSKLDIK